MRELLAELYRRNRLLTLVGWLHVALLIGALGMAAADSRSILGINPWIKPMKFMASITVFVWTMAWLMGHLPGPRWALRTISVGISVAMIVEIACISFQSARGTTSHFNFANPFDGLVFTIMGLMIVFNTLLAAWVCVLFFTQRVALEPVYLWGIRLGLLVFLAGSAEGGIMVNHQAHTVGAPDGGPGLPITNWSTQAGDLRVAHALGLHALQVLPLAGYVLGRWRAQRSSVPRIGLLAVFATLYATVTIGLFMHAMNGLPLIHL